jgi:hypothetical protein
MTMTEPTETATAVAVRDSRAELMTPPGGIFGNLTNFENGQRIARALVASDLVPQQYKGNIPNALIALDVAQRMNLSPMLVMQNLNVIHGRPSWSSQFVISAINACGKFSPLRFTMGGTPGADDFSCRAWAIEKATGERLDGPPVSIAMAKAEGWYSRKDRNGNETSKWPSMPELMIRYRAAAFFGRLYAPELLSGLHTAEEVSDIIDVTPAGPVAATVHVSAPEALAERATRRRRPKAEEAPIDADAPPAGPEEAPADAGPAGDPPLF